MPLCAPSSQGTGGTRWAAAGQPTLTRVATVTAHVVSAQLNRTAVSRRAVVRHLSPRLARTRVLVSHASLAARGPTLRSRTAPSRERRRGAAAAHTLAVVTPVVARAVTAHCRRSVAPPHPVAAATATPTHVATATAHVVTARLNHAAVSRRAVHISPRATVFVVTYYFPLYPGLHRTRRRLSPP